MTTLSEPKTVPIWARPRVIGSVLAVALIGASVAGTTFVDNSSIAVKADTAIEFADANYETVVVPAVEKSAHPLGDLLTALAADPNAAGEEFGKREDEGKPYSFATEVEGTVVEGLFGEIGLDVQGLPAGLTVGIAIPPLGSNTAIRDAGTDLTFGDFVNQTEYQNVAIELNKKVAEAVYGSVDPKSLIGKKVTVVGAFTWVSKTGAAIDHVTILPVSLEVAP